MRIALVSLDQVWQDKAANFARCRELVKDASAAGCEAVFFPEMTLTGYSLDVSAVAEDAASESLRLFGDLARETGVELVFGACIRNPATGMPRNVLCHADPRGEAREIYAKIHPFTYAREEQSFESGTSLGFIDLPGFRLGASICYDLRFPEMFGAMAARCDGVVCVANWPEARVAHWRLLLAARAVENQLWAIGVNRVGVDGNALAYARSSLVISPDGREVAPVTSSPEMDIYEIDPREAARYRREFPTLRDRKQLAHSALDVQPWAVTSDG